MESLDPLTPLFWKLTGLAVACGGVVGLERQLRGKVVGVRTAILICFGTALFVRLGASVAGAGADPTRVLGQVVTGVGFLGAGVMLTRGGMVHGVTTASVIWMLAAIGATIGLDYNATALVVAGLTVALLWGIDFLEDRIAALSRGEHANRGNAGAS